MLLHFSASFLLAQLVTGISVPLVNEAQQPLQQVSQGNNGISVRLFASLERLARLVDIAYCVGTTGISQPFQCASRCKDFPTLALVKTWNTGVMMTDSCGYIALDHGVKQHPPATATASLPAHGAEVLGPQATKGAIIVAFRGTYSITNTVVDLSTVPQEYVPYPSPEDGGDEPPEEPKHRCSNCTVHTGFLSSWKTARKVVLPAVKSLRTVFPDRPIYLVGHSLGGAVAALAALEMKVILRWDNVLVTTFGEPRVGNTGFARYLDAVFDLKSNNTRTEDRSYRRVTHANDPVPLLPLSEWGYRSHAGEIFISKASLSPSVEEIRTCEGDYDPDCIAGSAGETREIIARRTTAKRWQVAEEAGSWTEKPWEMPTRLKLWQLFFAHRDYFWRLGVCLPGGDPFDWEKDRYANISAEAGL